MTFNRTLILTLAAEFLILAGLTWAVDRWQRKRRLDRKIAAIIRDLDTDLASLLGAPGQGGEL